MGTMTSLLDNPATTPASPTVLPGRISGAEIQANVPDSELASLVFDGRVVILKGVFHPQLMLDLRRATRTWWETTPQYPTGQSPDTTPAVNYHRIDDGTIRSALPHVFHQSALNTLTDLPGGLADLAATPVELMRRLQNRLAGTDLPVALTGLRVKILHYPSGGGFLAAHLHPFEPQRIGLITSLARIGADFKSGGTTFVTPFGFVDTSESHDIGDVILFRYDLLHAVTAVDEGATLDWASDAGKWSLVLDLRDTHRHSRRGLPPP
jgi:hypothetical protein